MRLKHFGRFLPTELMADWTQKEAVTLVRHTSFVRVPFLSEADSGGATMFARFPVTVAEYGEFMRVGGYAKSEFWSVQGWAWKTEHSVTQPTYWNDKHYSRRTYPITGVSYWEAEAYANFRGCDLPTDEEWLKVATNNGQDEVPWRETRADLAHINYAITTFFGAFERRGLRSVYRSRASKSELGVRDLIGNCSEWIRNFDGKNAQGFGILRGGSHWNPPVAGTPFFWDRVPYNVRDNQTGIRLVKRTHPVATGKRGGTVNWRKPEPTALPMARTGKPIKRPTKPFRQEGIPSQYARDRWKLSVSGQGIQPREFTLDELKAMQVKMDEGLFVCVCRWSELNKFRGVSVENVLRACGFTDWHKAGRLFLRQRSMPGTKRGPDGEPLVYETTLTLEQARESILIYDMDDRPLTPELGAPIRLIHLGLYGYKTVKCLSELVITDEYKRGWWEKKCQYDLNGTIQPGSVTVVGQEPRLIEIEQEGRVRTKPFLPKDR